MDFPQKTSLIRWRNSYEISLLTPAKLNLYLNVVGKYPGGFHEIESIMARITLCDELIIRKDKMTKIICNDKSLENEGNLSLKAVFLLKKELRIKENFLLILKKRIPQGSGLGGASSNAAFTLLGINEILGLRLSKKELFSLGKELGSDVNFFLADTPLALVEGRGEKINCWKFLPSLKFFIVYPNFRSSTSLVFNNLEVKGKLTKSFSNVNIIFYALKNKDNALLKEGLFNILERVAFRIYPKLKRKKELLKELGFVMTGSGSSFFALKEKEKFKLRNFFKNWLIFEVSVF
ncbi:MAG: 4-(cytidine 5'-diphospho)-2-C-methyl-D-erythritol kinase [Candidatus Omnitrophica bacterium 4484_70.1]|nr:MAG: 4-(cytidine 5'-diphospho)-2-C-methyl-D-erythritol kinase [Candidatus Omnitrophica bacterium 4484_70.1]